MTMIIIGTRATPWIGNGFNSFQLYPKAQFSIFLVRLDSFMLDLAHARVLYSIHLQNYPLGLPYIAVTFYPFVLIHCHCPMLLSLLFLLCPYLVIAFPLLSISNLFSICHRVLSVTHSFKKGLLLACMIIIIGTFALTAGLLFVYYKDPLSNCQTDLFIFSCQFQNCEIACATYHYCGLPYQNHCFRIRNYKGHFVILALTEKTMETYCFKISAIIKDIFYCLIDILIAFAVSYCLKSISNTYLDHSFLFKQCS